MENLKRPNSTKPMQTVISLYTALPLIDDKKALRDICPYEGNQSAKINGTGRYANFGLLL